MFKPVEPELPKMQEVDPPKDPKVEDFVCNYGPLAAFTSFFATSSFLVSMSYLNSPLDTHSLYEVHLGIGVFGNFILGVVIPGIVAFVLFSIFNSKYTKNCQAFRAQSNFDQLMENSKRYRQDDYDRRVAEAKEKYQQDLEEYHKKYEEYKEYLARYNAEEEYRYANGIESQEVENARIDREMRRVALAGLAAFGAYHAKRDHDRREQWRKENEEWTANMKAESKRREELHEIERKQHRKELEAYRKTHRNMGGL